MENETSGRQHIERAKRLVTFLLDTVEDEDVPCRKRMRVARSSTITDGNCIESPDTASGSNSILPVVVIKQPQSVDKILCEKMVSDACVNITNVNNIIMLEWSEAVLLCLTIPYLHPHMTCLTWFDVTKLLLTFDDGEILKSAMATYFPPHVSLLSLFESNRFEKLRRGYVTDTSIDAFMFVTKPCPDITLLLTFRSARRMPVMQRRRKGIRL